MLSTEIREAVKAPLRSDVQTADWAVNPMSSTKLGEVVFDIEQIIKKREEKYLELIEDFIFENDDCSYDHHALCQAHNLDKYPCPHQRAKELLNEVNRESKDSN